MAQKLNLLIVRFIKDYGIYAAQDQASFNENFAATLVQAGIARIVGPVDPAPQQLELQLQPVVPDDRNRRK